MNAQTNQIATREPSPMIELKHELEKRTDSFRMALPSHIKPEDLQRTVLMAAQQNPAILQADRRSLILSCMKAAQDGLLPDGREAALVPFNTREKDGQGKWISVKQVQYMPMVYGMRKKIMQSDEISVMQVGVVYRAEYESGRFLFELGMEPPIRYRPDLSLSVEETEDDCIVAAFSLVKFKDGSWSAEVMRRSEIDKIRQLSQTGAVGQVVKFGTNKGKSIDPKGPWVDHFGEMAKKTVMRRHSKVLPMSGDIFRDVEGEEIDQAARSAVATLDAVEPDAPAALPTGDELDAQAEGAGDQVDVETGEIKTDARGMTEVDEETARQLDAGEPADQPKGNQPESGGSPDEKAGAKPEGNRSEPDPAAKRLADVRAQIESADSLAAVNLASGEWAKHRVAYDEGTIAEIDALVTAAFKRVRGGEG